MTWKSHKLLTLVLVWAFTHNVFYSFIASVGAIIPDFLEGKGFLYDYEKWMRTHRTYSHWLIPYAIVFLICFLGMGKENFVLMRSDFLYFPSQERIVLFFMFSALSLGCLLHILEDAVSGKVPLWHPKKRVFGVRLIRTRSFLEYVFVFVVVVLVIAYKYMTYVEGGKRLWK
jgi:inner membrane protein